MPDDPSDYSWRFSASPLADPDDDQWIYVEGAGLRQPLYLRIARTGPPVQPFGGSDLVVTGVLINNGQPVTSTDLRLPLQRILEQFARHLRSEAADVATKTPAQNSSDWAYQKSGVAEYDEWVASMASLPPVEAAPRGRGAPPPTEDELRAFAAVYAHELRLGARGAVTRSAEKFGMHRVTAHKWIQRCREAGILPSEESDR